MGDERKTETLAKDAPAPRAPTSAPGSIPRGLATLPAHYQLRERLAAGAMGEVFQCRDTRIERVVALKTMIDAHRDDSALRERFEHEVRVQGQLEHPAIVPVYDFVTTADGTAFFTMRRVHGRSLREVIDLLADPNVDEATAQRYGRRRLLGAFATICNAVAFAHARGVIHRDIKPSNIMLGDYGEVYLLDWGIARVTTAPALTLRNRGAARPLAGLTEAGDVIGTIGYMAPEQLRGEPVDGRADVYALGATLFEILALAPLHERETDRATTKTLAGLEPRDYRGLLDRDVAPELVDLCVRATALDPDKRVPGAMTLHDAIEAYLDGQRDREARHRQSVLHARRARAASVEAIVAHADETASAAAREAALQEANRALVLDPKNGDALEVLRALVGGASTSVVTEAEEAVRTLSSTTRRFLARSGLVLVVAWLVALLLMLSLGNGPGRRSVMVAIVGLVPAIVFLYRALHAQSRFITWGALVAVNVAAGCSSALLGPFIVFPSVFSAIAVAFETQARPKVWAKRFEPDVPALGTIATVLSLVTFLVACSLEFAGVVRPSLMWYQGDLVVQPPAALADDRLSVAFITLTQALALAAPATIVVMRARDHMFEVQRRAFDAAARVRQLLPKETRNAAGDLVALADSEPRLR